MYPPLLHGTQTATGHHALSGTGPLVAVAVLVVVVVVAVVLTREDEPTDDD